ncbi:hypothetical protein D3C76_758950 [compost metagenome]|jgi:hypothetical protein
MQAMSATFALIASLPESVIACLEVWLTTVVTSGPNEVARLLQAGLRKTLRAAQLRSAGSGKA